MSWLKGFVFLLLLSSSHAASLPVDTSTSYVKTSPFMDILLDEKGSFALEDVLENTAWHTSTFSNIPNNRAKVVWTRFEIENTTSNPLTLYLKNPRAGMDFIDVYVLADQKVIKTEHLGDQRSMQAREIPHRYSIMRLSLAAYQTVEIVTQLSNSIGPNESEWELYSESAFFRFSLMESLWWGVFLGIIVALLVYSTPILLLTKDKRLALYFGLYVFFSLSYQFFLQGVFYSFGVPSFSINMLLQFSGLFFGLFMVLFIDRFLKLNRADSFLQWVFRCVIVLQIANGFLLVLCLFFPALIPLVSSIGLFGGLLACFLWFGLIKQLLSAALDRIFYYLLIGYSVIMLAIIYQALTITGYVAISVFSIYSVSVASIIEMYFFTLSIAAYLREIKLDHARKDKLIESQMRFVSIGRVVGNISHQWKVPLVRLSALLTHIEAALYVKSAHLQTELEEIIPQMHTNLDFMQQTIDEFYSLYHAEQCEKVFDLVKTTHAIWNMLDAKAILVNMKREIHAPATLELQGSEHAFAHIMMILIDNAIEVAKTRTIREPKLRIGMEEDALHVKLTVEDNCGGLESNVPLNSMFEMDVSSHHDPKRHEIRGMGLSIAKLLVEGKFGGTIGAKAHAQGLCFTLTLLKR